MNEIISSTLVENNPDVVAELTATNAQLKEKPLDHKAYLKLNRKFHDLFADHETNDIVTEQYHFYSENILTATRSAYFPSDERLEAVIAERDTIIKP